MTHIVRCFNQKALDFLNDLLFTFPDDDELRMLKSAFLVSTSHDASEPIRQFVVHVVPFSDLILKRDADAFFSGSGVDNQIVQKIGHHWDVMSESDRESSWSVLQLLLALAQKYS